MKTIITIKNRELEYTRTFAETWMDNTCSVYNFRVKETNSFYSVIEIEGTNEHSLRYFTDCLFEELK